MNEEILAKIEALIFTALKPISLKKISATLELNEDIIIRYLDELKTEYDKKLHGFNLKEYNGEYIFKTKYDMAPYIKKLHSLEKNISLSQAAMETLAIIAYRQPITRTDIESIRDVKVEKTLLTLSKYDLIKELGRKDTIGNPIVYGTTDEFLEYFDINNLSELPEIEE